VTGVVLGALAAIVAIILTPASGSSAESGFQGLPRLVAYVVGGIALAVTVPRCARALRPDPEPTSKRGLAALAVGAVAALAVMGIEVARLDADLADSAGPVLWIGSMLVLVGTSLVPLVRRIGWHAAWPAFALEHRWLGICLLLLIASAAVLRLPWLEHIPAGINADEGDRAASAFDVLSGTAPRSWFDSGWFYISMVYFHLLAATFVLFGTDVGGGRMLNAMAGVGFVAVVAWLGSRHFGWRVGLLAAGLSAGVGMSLQHSRMISETGPTALLWAISLAGFVEGARRGRPWAFILAGVCGGLSLYFYPAARLWAVGASLTAAALLIAFWQRPAVWIGIASAAVAAVVAAAPFLVHMSHNRLEFANRFVQTSVLDPANQVRLPYLRPPEALPRLAALQVERTLGMFDRHPDGGGLLPTGRPVFPSPLAALVLLSVVYATVRGLRDLRLALLAIWFWVGLSGVLLTVETPNVLRAVGILPSLFVIVAVLLVDVVDRVLTFANSMRPSGARRAYAVLVPALLGLLIIAFEVNTYFTFFRTLPGAWGASTREGQQVASLGASGPVFSLEMNEHMVTSGWVRLLAPNAKLGRLPNPGRDLLHLSPAPVAGEGFSLLFSHDPHQRVYFDLARDLYPGGRFVDAADGRLAYVVPASALDTTRGVMLRRVGASPRSVSAFGAVSEDLELPATLTWSGGVWFAGGQHRLGASGPGQLVINVDGDEVVRGSRSIDVDVVAARGLHFVELIAELDQMMDRVALNLDEVEVGGKATYRLMDTSWGLLGRIASVQSAGFVDATVAMAFFDPSLGPMSTPNTITWSGVLLAPASGVYRMVFAAEDKMRLEIDGQAVDVATVPPGGWDSVGLGSTIYLRQGPHRVLVTLEVTHGGRDLARWNWVLPQADGSVNALGEWSVVPPTLLRPDASVRRV
jgi:Dolichyl-phosphate-mannose-protein mannosyltransferase